MRTLKACIIGLLLNVYCLQVFAEEPIQLQDVIGTSSVKQRKVHITGDSIDLQREAEQLFQLHGGIRITSETPHFRFHFRPSGARGVELTISSAGKELLRESFSGENRTRALYLAADRAIEKTLGIPGFFNSTIAFISDRTGKSEVYLSDILFKQIRQLTNDRSDALSPNLSPNKDALLYTSYYKTGFPDIYKIDLATSRRITFAGFQGTNTGATFSPNGRSVAMILSGSGNSELYLSDVNGRNLKRLTRTRSIESDPTWSPDGRRLALTSDQLGKPQIYTVDVSGRNLRRVQTDISRHCAEPSWNPYDSDKIAFTAAVAGEFELAVYSFKERKSRILSRGPGDAVHPTWLRDGRHIVYTERTRSYRRLMLLDTESGKRTVLSPGEMRNAREASIAY